MALLTKANRELAVDGIYTWSIPALGARLTNGKTMITCPNAGVCANLCYARNGTYRFSNVVKAHVAKLEISLDSSRFVELLTNELQQKKFNRSGVPQRFLKYLPEGTIELLSSWQQDWLASGGRAVRIHDSGDFYSSRYFDDWMTIARNSPHVFFYTYTKEVKMVKDYGVLPENVVVIYSYGGKQDSLIDPVLDRHSEVFPSFEMMEQAGYSSNEASDILAALLPTTKIGLVSNNIPHFKKKQGSLTFREMQSIVQKGDDTSKV